MLSNLLYFWPTINPDPLAKLLLIKKRVSGSHRLRMLLYADDIVIFCEDVDELQSILKIYDETFTRFGLTIEIDKTKTLSFNINKDVMNKKSLISLRGEPIEIVRRFKYLGHVLSNEALN